MFRKLVTRAFHDAGIAIGGDEPGDIKVTRDRFYRRAALFESLGIGDSYRDGDFVCGDLSAFFDKLMVCRQEEHLTALKKGTADPGASTSLLEAWIKLRQEFGNQQSMAKASKSITHHYDIGNELYEPMLGETMAYSCGYWAGAKTLDQAQRNKYRLICEKVGLKPGMRVLEIGCGWGGFAAYAAGEFGVAVVGVSLSKEQINYAQAKYKDLHETRRIDLRLMDYRAIPKNFGEEFDAVVSIGMFEHVGPRNYDDYMRIAWGAMKPAGVFLLHSIVGCGGIDPFFWYRIFPGGVLPVEEQIAKAARPYFAVEHVENFGYDYSLTLAQWWKNFEAAWPQIRKSGHYDEKFYRMWEFYLKSVAAAFKVRRVQLEQWTLSKCGIPGGFQWNRPHYQH